MKKQKKQQCERYPLVLASNLVGRTMLVIQGGFLADGSPAIKARVDKKHIIFKAGKATNAQLDQAKILPSWAKLVEVDGRQYRYHKFVWAETLTWKHKRASKIKKAVHP